MSRFLHILQDSGFDDFVIDLFEDYAPNQNLFITCKPYKDQIFKRIKNSEKVVIHIQGRKPEFESTEVFAAVFLHSLNETTMEIIDYVHPDSKLCWFPWGYDMYPYCWKQDKLLLPYTYEYWKLSQSPQGDGLRSAVKKLISNVKSKFFKQKDKRFELFPRIDYCSTIVPTEYPIVQSIKGFRAEELRFNYGSMERIVARMKNVSNMQDHIFIGNSNTMSSNHVDAFHRIAALAPSDRKVLVPLSYGNTENYRQYVIEKGKYFFGANFEPICDYIPPEKYIELISTCGTAIFNQVRQQALGTILILSWLGSCIYLNSVNPIFEHFTNIGVNVYDFSKTQELKNSEPDDLLKQTRKNLMKDYCEDVIRLRVQKIIDKLNP